ncbi:MAG TPA: glycosyltransferase family 4 protein [Prolixibacteraceae bacterium]|nr:glycosyltransferase family 4 protein [Prolixibacteraceae bacterium]OQB80344.1 MAG: putative teichuronic acid biosynthesis glycosyltransferase TuaC [Bacteroidetes bacterium ADurb.Bin123]HOF54847.1 glycosyltransferase family 4 protein [Prolixibacteraceae bacterium]HOR99812.1 glycosyltransferase family 4 protein [Prolixibacteraceae bacterium]HOS89702.1 glycosyltransferase family 4 protein [Prolixibacteraceae bacterium]
MRILVITIDYPSPRNITRGIFLYRLVQKFVDYGHQVTVISPESILDLFKSKNYYGHEKADVYRPIFFSFGAKKIGSYNTYSLTHLALVAAVRRTEKKYNLMYDVVYCKFIRNGILAIDAIKKYQKPVIVDVGENQLLDLTVKWFTYSRFIDLVNRMDGFIAVSDQVKEKLHNFKIRKEKIIVAPNGVDCLQFRKLDKISLREKFNFPQDKIIIAFTGNFIESKGPDRLLMAIEGLNNIKAIFIGGGPIDLISNQIVFKQRVPAFSVHELLNCADIFVLPTLHEGNNNSIIEAMACGLPIISSDIPEVRSQCDPSFSILVNPMDVSAIRNSIIKLATNAALREKMSANAMAHSKRYDLNKRSKTILEFMKSLVEL